MWPAWACSRRAAGPPWWTRRVLGSRRYESFQANLGCHAAAAGNVQAMPSRFAGATPARALSSPTLWAMGPIMASDGCIVMLQGLGCCGCSDHGVCCRRVPTLSHPHLVRDFLKAADCACPCYCPAWNEYVTGLQHCRMAAMTYQPHLPLVCQTSERPSPSTAGRRMPSSLWHTWLVTWLS